MSTYWTIEGFENLSKQDIFDKAVAHIAETRRKSTNGTACCYGGSGCAASPLLKRGRIYEADALNGGWSKLVLKCFAPPHEEGFIVQVQRCHDRAPADHNEFLADWKNRMQRLAKTEGLDTKLLDEVQP